MKEATYKAWSALGGRTLDHEEVRLSIFGQRFRADIVSDATSFIGSWRAAAGRWITLVIVRKDPYRSVVVVGAATHSAGRGRRLGCR